MPDELKVTWSEAQNDFVVAYPKAKCDGHLAYGVFFNQRFSYSFKDGLPTFDPAFVDELESRGYDTKTLSFSVKLKADTSI